MRAKALVGGDPPSWFPGSEFEAATDDAARAALPRRGLAPPPRAVVPGRSPRTLVRVACALATVLCIAAAAVAAPSASAASATDRFLGEWSITVQVHSEGTAYFYEGTRDATYTNGRGGTNVTWTGSLDETSGNPINPCKAHTYGNGRGRGTLAVGAGGFIPAEYAGAPASPGVAFVGAGSGGFAIKTDWTGCGAPFTRTGGPVSPETAGLFLPLSAAAYGRKPIGTTLIWRYVRRVTGTGTSQVTTVSYRLVKLRHLGPPAKLTVKAKGKGRVLGTLKCKARRLVAKSCSKKLNVGDVARLAGLSDVEGTSVVEWSGCDAVNGTRCRVDMNGDRTVTVEFKKQKKPFGIGYEFRSLGCEVGPAQTMRVVVVMRMIAVNGDATEYFKAAARDMTASVRLEHPGRQIIIPGGSRPWTSQSYSTLHTARDQMGNNKRYQQDFTLRTDWVNADEDWQLHLRYHWSGFSYHREQVDTRSADPFETPQCAAIKPIPGAA